MGTSSDIEIMLRVRDGETSKLAILYERYKQSLYAYFFRLTRDTYSSEDLVQNVFLRVLKYSNRFTGYGSFKAWMYRIAHNVFVDHTRKNNRYQNMTDFDELSLVDYNTQDIKYIQNEQLQLLDNALHKLPKEQQEVLVLSKYQQLKYREIAEILQCTEGNVKIKVYRALIELKEKFKQLENIDHEE